jgi:hypothetical protein
MAIIENAGAGFLVSSYKINGSLFSAAGVGAQFFIPMTLTLFLKEKTYADCGRKDQHEPEICQ